MKARHLIVGLSAYLSSLACLAMTEAPVQPLNEPYRHCNDAAYQLPGAQELDRVQRLFARHFAGHEDPSMAQAWDSLGMTVEQRHDLHGAYQLIREQTGQCRGRGVFAFRSPVATGPVLQAPHSFHDRHTGRIATQLFNGGQLRAVAWNTVSRRTETADGSRQADMAHTWDSYFMAFSRAYAANSPEGHLIQLHGFSQKKRNTAEAAGATVILSSGTNFPGAHNRKLATCLSRHVEPVLLYPQQVSELGGTRNSIGQALRQSGFSGFSHLEMSPSLRKALRDDAQLQANFGTCIAGSVAAP